MILKDFLKTSSGGQGQQQGPSHHFLNRPPRNIGAKTVASALQGKPLAQLKKESAVARGGRGPGIKAKGRE